MRTLLKGTVTAIAVWAALLALAPEATACTYLCVKVAPLCRRCLDVGTTTNATCEDLGGPCGCFWTQNTCGLLTSNTFGESLDEPVITAAQAEAPSSCLAAAESEATLFAELEARQ